MVLLISSALLLAGVFLFKKLWTGAAAGIIFLTAARFYKSEGVLNLEVPAIDTVLIWIELALLLFGAYIFCFMLDDFKQWNAFRSKALSSNSRMTVVLLFGWFLISFLEGLAGFGVPAMLVAPLLLSIGLKPFTSIVLSLCANAISVTFGALGTPVKIGLGVDVVNPVVNSIVILNALPALLTPFVLALIFWNTEAHFSWKAERKKLFGAGLCFLVPFAIGSLLSVEFPSVLGGGAGMLIFTLFFIPAAERPSFRLWISTFWPYALFLGLLILSSFLLKPFSWQLKPGVRNFSAFQPGILFLIATLLVLLIKKHSHPARQFLGYAKQTFIDVRVSLFSIFLLILFTQLIRTETQIIFETISLWKNSSLFQLFPLILGTLGSFLTGSATMSNLLFADNVGEHFIFPLSLALLNTGSACGNAISLQNIVMVKSTIVANVSEASILKHNFVFVVAYMIVAALGAIILFQIV